MLRYVRRRLVHSTVVVVLVLSLVFVAASVIGDPVRLMLPPTATAAEVASLRTSLGLDDPLAEQFGRFMGGAVQGDFGESLWTDQPAFSMALDRVDNTLLLGGCAIVLSFLVGASLGMLAANRRGGWIDRFVSVYSLTAVSVVEFWVALILIYVFAVKFGVLPTSGHGTLATLVLPTCVLALRPSGRIAQFTRAALSDELKKPYVRAAVARGIPRRRIVAVHGLKNISVPLLTLTGDEFIAVVSTAVVIEIIFAWPGVGSLLLQAIQHRDLPLVEACVFIFTILVVLTNLAVDLTYGFLDRRARVA